MVKNSTLPLFFATNVVLVMYGETPHLLVISVFRLIGIFLKKIESLRQLDYRKTETTKTFFFLSKMMKARYIK